MVWTSTNGRQMVGYRTSDEMNTTKRHRPLARPGGGEESEEEEGEE